MTFGQFALIVALTVALTVWGAFTVWIKLWIKSLHNEKYWEELFKF